LSIALNSDDVVYFYNFSARNLPDYSLTDFNSMIVKNGVIATAGKNIQKPKEKHRLVDLNHAVIFPPFTDAHVHFMQTGVTMIGCDLSKAKSIKQVLRAVKKESQHPWALGWQMQEGQLKEGRTPSLKELDRASGEAIVWLTRADLHSAVVNSKGQAWVNGQLRNSRFQDNCLAGSENLIDGEAYYFLASKVLESISKDFKVQALRRVEGLCLAQGVGTVHAFEGDEINEADSVLVADFFKKSPVHGVVYHQSTSPSLPLKMQWKQMGGCLMVDGAFGSHTAALYEDYADKPGNQGALYKKAEEIIEIAKTANYAGLQLAMHAIGDRANDLLATAYLAAKEKCAHCRRHRMEHFILPTFKAIRNAKQADTFIGVQPAFDYYWGGKKRLYEQRLGAVRAAKCNPFKTLLDSGLRLAGGSDSPVTSINPILGVHALVNHSNIDERIDLNSALEIFIANAHEFSGEAGHRGFLREGFHADFICLSKDPFKTSRKKIKKLKVTSFYLRGNLIYSKESGFARIRSFLLGLIKKSR
jgi:predicted amidohydrolase YtcJ